MYEKTIRFLILKYNFHLGYTMRWEDDIKPAQELVQVKKNYLKTLLVVYAGAGAVIGCALGLYLSGTGAC